MRLQTFYYVGVAFAVILIVSYFYQRSSSKGDEKYGDGIAFSSLGEKPHMKFFKRFTTPQITLLCLILFGILGLINITTVGQKTYTGVGALEVQQFTPVDSMLYSATLIPGAENLGSAAFISLLIVFLGILARKKKFSYGTYSALLFVIVVFGTALFGIGNHLLRYRSSEIALITVGFFWGLGGLLTVATGSFVPFWIMHIMNNLFYDMSRLFTTEQIFIYTVIGLAILIGTYSIIYNKRLLGKKRA